jgi:hypothetical protein
MILASKQICIKESFKGKMVYLAYTKRMNTLYTESYSKTSLWCFRPEIESGFQIEIQGHLAAVRSAFINFIFTVITCRILRKAE